MRPPRLRAQRKRKPCGGGRRNVAARSRQRGNVALFFLMFLIPLLSFAAFAIDMARVTAGLDELQNAADAAALAGAASLIQSTTSGPNWSLAQSSAASAVSLNKSDGVSLASGTVATGYWNLTGTPSSMEAATITPGTYDMPAVQVTVSRAAGVNGGPFALLLGGIMKVQSASGSATAVATVVSPSTISAGGLFPLVLDQCVYNLYWNSATNAPVVNTSTGAPYELQLTNNQTYGSSSCGAGEWTSFQTNSNGATTMTGLISSGNPSSLAIGSSIYVQSATGMAASVYSAVPAGTTVIVPVATQTMSASSVSIVAFAAFEIDSVTSGSASSSCTNYTLGLGSITYYYTLCNGVLTYFGTTPPPSASSYIQGHFVGGYKVPVPASGVGPNYGAYAAPRLGL
jgi:Flp pilus assembly protein TadG